MSDSQSPEQTGQAETQPGRSFDILRGLASNKKKTRSGEPQKRRGPKPNSKPALTRRQELNRQAQRSHRERKEFYVKALEEEVVRLKETYTSVAQDRERLSKENKLLRDALAQRGVASSYAATIDETMTEPSFGDRSTDHHTSPDTRVTSLSPAGFPSQPQRYCQQASGSRLDSAGLRAAQDEATRSRGTDYEQAGVDFVLTVEKPCFEHMNHVVSQSATDEGRFCGHTLMATCHPGEISSLPVETSPFGYAHSFETDMPTWEINKADISNLLDLSKKLNLDGEITPVMAWGMLMAHPRLLELDTDDIKALAAVLSDKARCYGFGAVLEEFELRDAIESVLSRRVAKMSF